MGKGGRAMGVGDYVVSLRRRDRLFVLSFHSFHSKLVNHDSSLCPWKSVTNVTLRSFIWVSNLDITYLWLKNNCFYSHKMHRFSYLQATNIFIQRERQYSIARFVILSKPLLNEAGNTPMSFTSFIILPRVQLQSLIFRCTPWPIILLYISIWKGGARNGGMETTLWRSNAASGFLFCLFIRFIRNSWIFVFSSFFEKLWRKPP